ncbi:MAG: hypothetical protein GF333_07525 [Candidatus Omnitrophica bacterium]|nr:hypothetical protein [Candidatus Omnitrophota bacterium]
MTHTAAVRSIILLGIAAGILAGGCQPGSPRQPAQQEPAPEAAEPAPRAEAPKKIVPDEGALRCTETPAPAGTGTPHAMKPPAAPDAAEPEDLIQKRSTAEGKENEPAFTDQEENGQLVLERGRVKIFRLARGGYRMFVNEEPFLIKGVIYNPTPIGKGYNYEFYNDPAKPWLTDGKLMEEMGINCVRVYCAGSDLEKTREFIRDMYEKFGIYTVLSDWIGLWEYPPPNYADPQFQKKTTDRILETVETLKDEEGLLMWVLGNENNYTFSGKIGFWTNEEIEALEEPCDKIFRKAEIYYSFVNDLAKKIKEIDPDHPVALSNGEESFLDIASREAPQIDILAIISYRGKRFGSLFRNVRNFYDKPVFLSEFGADSYDSLRKEPAPEIQAEYLLSQWESLYKNSVWSGNERGNVLGGIIFEWTDEWWKHNEGYEKDWNVHNPEAGWSEGAYYYDIRAENNMNMSEEWFGIVGIQREVKEGLNLREPKDAYFALQQEFTRPLVTRPLDPATPTE